MNVPSAIEVLGIKETLLGMYLVMSWFLNDFFYICRHMALHDPESSEHAKALAMKIGRQKKIQIIDGQRVEVLTGESEDEEDPDLDNEGIPMQSEDGQHYVVLEVIQLPDDGSGTSQGVVQLQSSAPGDHQDFSTQNIAILPSILEEGPILETDMTQASDHSAVHQEQIRIKKEQERANCFGFDDSDEDV